MIYTSDSLKSEVFENWEKITSELPPNWPELGTPEVETAKGYKAYGNAYHSLLPFIILGAETIRSETTLLQNMGTLGTETATNRSVMRAFLKNVSSKTGREFRQSLEDHLHRGAVLNESKWWIFRNDLFMLGAIHAGKEFHVATTDENIPDNDLLWDKKENRPRVLGREVIMLHLAGYKKVEADSRFGHVFVPPSDGERKPLTLQSFKEGLTQFKSVSAIHQLFQDVVASPSQIPSSDNDTREILSRE